MRAHGKRFPAAEGNTVGAQVLGEAGAHTRSLTLLGNPVTKRQPQFVTCIGPALNDRTFHATPPEASSARVCIGNGKEWKDLSISIYRGSTAIDAPRVLMRFMQASFVRPRTFYTVKIARSVLLYSVLRRLL